MRKDVEEGKKMKAPLFCVPLRLYRLVSPVRDRHLCSFQKLQTQSPESSTVAGSGGKRKREGEGVRVGAREGGEKRRVGERRRRLQAARFIRGS